MKIKSVLILALGASAFTATAQFNTVSPHRALYVVDAVADSAKAGKKQEMVPTRHREDTINLEDKKKEWADLYMSVSYPLRKIEVTSGYGERIDPFTGKRTRHNGLDLRASQGDEAYAMMFGQVIKVGSDNRSGKYVTLRHGDFTVSYCHLSKPLVKTGQIVTAGEPVGLTGSTGCSTGPHLHLSLKRGRKIIHPRIMIDYIRTIREEAIFGICTAYDERATKSQHN